MKYELYKKEQEAMQKQFAEAAAESLQKQRTRKEAQFLKLQQEVEVCGAPPGFRARRDESVMN